MKKSEITAIIKELAEYTRMKEELEAQMDELKDQIKAHMTEENVEELLGDNGEHVVWKKVVRKSMNVSALKKSEWAEIYDMFATSSETRPFKFYA